MSGAQHTPGPWQRFDNGGATSSGVTYGESYSDCVWGPDGPGWGLVADCSPHGQAPTGETIANARLIAAAPDLLAALRVFAECADQLDGDEYTPRAPDDEYAKFRLLTDHYRAARAAVAKAIGK